MGCSSGDATAALASQKALTRSPQHHREECCASVLLPENPASCTPGYFPHSDMRKLTWQPWDVLPFPASCGSPWLSRLPLVAQRTAQVLFPLRPGVLVASGHEQDQQPGTASEQPITLTGTTSWFYLLKPLLWLLHSAHIWVVRTPN